MTSLSAVENFLSDINTFENLHGIGSRQTLSSVFQPIISIKNGSILGHEGLIRGLENTQLHSPVDLFTLAKQKNKVCELELLSLQIGLESFAKHYCPNKIFINVSPECLLRFDHNKIITLSYIENLGLNPTDIVLELTEGSPIFDYSLLYSVINSYRNIRS